MTKFVNLHAHSDASLADGLFSPKKWVKALKDRGYLAHTFTDHGSMTNILPFYNLMKQEKMIPLIGCEFYYVDNPEDKTPENRKASHLILIAKNYDGFRNMLRLSQLSYGDGYYYKPRIGLEWLSKYKEGLVCLTACQGGVLSNEVWAKQDGRESMGLIKRFNQFQQMFGDDLYVEFQGHNTQTLGSDGNMYNSQAMINKAFYDQLSGFKHVVTNDCHYILPEHAAIQRAVKEMMWNRKDSSEVASSDSATVTKEHFTDSLWLKSHVQVYEAFRTHHEYLPKQFVIDGIKNTVEVMEKCKDLVIPNKKYLPTFSSKINSKEFFSKLTKKLLIEFLKSDRPKVSAKEYVERYKKELGVISKYGLEDYFLIVWDLIRFCQKKGIYSGIGRGSAAGCLISYLLDIVKIDPLEYKLIFERFLNENRCESGELPDIDLDIESDRRQEVKDYIFDKYGRDKVCDIGTYGRMKLKTCLIDLGKHFKAGTQSELLAITTNLDLEKEDVDDLEAAIKSDSKLQLMMEFCPEYKFATTELIGQIKTQGVHPAGVIICSEPIADVTPLKTQKSKSGGRVVTTQAEDKYVVAQGLMKCDILGLKEYDVIRYVIENADTDLTADNYLHKIQQQERERPNLKVWKMFQQGKTDACFQFASGGMRDLLQNMRPNSIEELAAANALYRPGCLLNGWHTKYCDRKHMDEETTYLHPILEDILGDTYGVCVFQEQVMEIIHKLGEISLVDSDTIRSALGKKNREKLAQFSSEFVKNASKYIGAKNAQDLWVQLEQSSEYNFNKSHAAAYAVLAYISQYLKVNYPAHFWAAQLDWDTRKNKLEDMLANKRAAQEMGVNFVLPEINRSKAHFKVEDSVVVWSLSSVKGIGDKVSSEIISKQPFSSFDDFYKRVNKTRVKYNNIESLIYAGAFDGMGDRRNLLSHLVALKKDKKRKYVSLSEEEMMIKFSHSMGFFERKIKKVRRGFSKKVITEQDLIDLGDKAVAIVGGIITSVRAIKTKKGDNMGFVTLMDLDEIIEVTCFSDFWKEFRSSLNVGSVVEFLGAKSSYNSKQNLLEAKKVRVL